MARIEVSGALLWYGLPPMSTKYVASPVHMFSMPPRMSSEGDDASEGFTVPRLYCPDGQLAASVRSVGTSWLVLASRWQMSVTPRRFESSAQRCSCRAMGNVRPTDAAVRVLARPVTSGDAKSACTRVFHEWFELRKRSTRRRNSGSVSSQRPDVA